jgi:hypothetical protein
MTASAYATHVYLMVSDESSVRFVVDSGATHIFVNTLLLSVANELGHGGGQESSHGQWRDNGVKITGLFNGLPVVYMPSFSSYLCSVSTMTDLG